MARPKRTPGLIVKIGLVALVSFIALELLLTIFNDLVFRNSFFVYDPDLGFKVRPYAGWGAYQANEFGFNDRDYPHQKAPGVYRILIISDSFNWAGGPEGNYTALLERKFQDHFGDSRVEVINAGYSQTHTGEQLKILKKFGLQYQPDLVVLGFFVGNDFIDAHPERKRIVVGSVVSDINIGRDLEISLWGQPLVLQSRLYLFLKEQWLTRSYVQPQASTQAAEVVPISNPAVSLPTEQYLALEYFRMQVANWEQASALRANETYIFDQMLAMRDLLGEQGIEFMVAAYPDEFQVDASLRQAVIERYQVNTSTYQWDRPQGLLWQFCTEHGIEFYDLLSTFREVHAQGQRLYLLNDSHWNEAGNTLAAQYLFDILIWKVNNH